LGTKERFLVSGLILAKLPVKMIGKERKKKKLERKVRRHIG
jgi:hypothetical protein